MERRRPACFLKVLIINSTCYQFKFIEFKFSGRHSLNSSTVIPAQAGIQCDAVHLKVLFLWACTRSVLQVIKYVISRKKECAALKVS